MSQMVTWEHYNSLSAVIGREDFGRLTACAEREVRAVIGPIRWATITEDTFGYEQLKDCICEVAEKIAADEKSGKGKGVSAVSNDGYSESYVIQTEGQLRGEIRTLIRDRLSGTGLAGAY